MHGFYRSALIVAMASIGSRAAMADGFNVAWDKCWNSGGIRFAEMPCVAGGSRVAVLTVKTDATLTGVVQFDAVIDIVGSNPLPDAWQFQAGGCHEGYAQLITSGPPNVGCAAAVPSPFNPLIFPVYPFAGNPSVERIYLSVAGNNPLTLNAGTEYVVFKVAFNNDGVDDPCAGCDTPVNIFVREVRIDRSGPECTSLDTPLVNGILGAGTGCAVLFKPKADYATGGFPTSLAFADLNQDGKLDLTVADRYSNALSVLLGNGLGGFGARTDFATGAGPTWVGIADFNEDGKLDFATTNQDQNMASVLLGNGDGTMGGHSDFATEVDPTALAIADLNGDANLDVAVANQSSASVSVLLGNGAGGLGAETHYAAGNGPLSIAVGDLDGAGGLDLAVANNYVSTVSVLLGVGDGTFAAATNYPTGDAPFSVVIADVNGDAKRDLVLANQGTNSVSVLLGDGAGGFGPRKDFPTGGSPTSVAIGDLDGDGKLDLATSNFEDHTVSVLHGDGLGDFAKQLCDFQTGNNPESIAMADLNGDGRLDVATVNYSANTVSVLLNRVPTLDAPRPTASPDIALGPAMPNPSHGVVRSSFVIPREMHVRLRIVDVTGRSVALLARGVFPAGRHEVVWNGMSGSRPAPTGMYFMNLEADGKDVMRRVVVAR